MTPVDLVVYGGLALAALYPFAGDALAAAKGMIPAMPKRQASHSDATRKWADTIICLIDCIDAGEVVVDDEEETTRIARDLIWKLIGGQDR